MISFTLKLKKQLSVKKKNSKKCHFGFDLVNLFPLLFVLSALSMSLCLSQSYCIYSQLCKYTVYLEGSLSTASAGRDTQKK